MSRLRNFHQGEALLQAESGVDTELFDSMVEEGFRPELSATEVRFVNQRTFGVAGSIDAESRPWGSPLVGPAGELFEVVDSTNVRIRPRSAPGDPLAENVRATGELGVLYFEPARRRRAKSLGRATVGSDGTISYRMHRNFGLCNKYIFKRGHEVEPSAPGDKLKPQYVIEQLRDHTPDDTIVASGVGQHQMFASQYWRFDHPYTWINSGGLGTMGFSIPAAIGAKAGMPDRQVWAIDGDGCFQMTAQELVTATVEGFPIKVALLNNSYLGMVRQWQEMFYDERYSEVFLSQDVPDYVMWAKSMGCAAFRAESPEEVVPAIEAANEVNDRPVVVEFRTDAKEHVFPMVPSGKSNSEILVHPTQEDRIR